jgi:TonB family protein
MSYSLTPFFLLFFVLCHLLVIGQEPSKDKLYSTVDANPTFVGGEEALATYLQKNGRYSPRAISQKKEGVVYVRMVVDTVGILKSIALQQGTNYELDAEAIRLVSIMPRWNPGVLDRERVHVLQIIGIRFRLEGKDGKPEITIPDKSNPPLLLPLRPIKLDSVKKDTLKVTPPLGSNDPRPPSGSIEAKNGASSINGTSSIKKLGDGAYYLNGYTKQMWKNCFQITPDDEKQLGSVWSSTKLDLRESFELDMNIFLGCRDTDGADGLIIGFQPISPYILQGEGGGMGFKNVKPSIGIELDTHHNEESSDPLFDHVAIFKNGDNNHGGDNNLAGPSPFLGAGPSPINIEDCKTHDILVLWDVYTKRLELYFDCKQVIVYTGDIVKDIFGGNPMVYWGITGSTGGERNRQEVCFNKVNYKKDRLVEATIAAGGGFQLAAKGGTTYKWTPITGLDNPYSEHPIAVPTETTKYIVAVSDQCNRVRYDSITINIEGKPLKKDTLKLDKPKFLTKKDSVSLARAEAKNKLREENRAATKKQREEEAAERKKESDEQKKEDGETNSDDDEGEVRRMRASYPGGTKALFAFMRKNIKLPSEVLDGDIKGAVHVRFVVDVDGNVTDITVKKSLSSACDDEAVRVVESMPKWIVPKFADKGFRAVYILPVHFRVKQKKKRKG